MRVTLKTVKAVEDESASGAGKLMRTKPYYVLHALTRKPKLVLRGIRFE